MSVNTLQPRNLQRIEQEFTAKGFSREVVYAIRQLIVRSDKTQNDDGSIKPQANISGRTEPLSTTLQNVDATGVITANGVDFTRNYVGKSLANVPDDAASDRRAATANQKTGGDRGFNALDANNRLVGSFRSNAVNIAGTPTGTTGLSNDGVSTAITVVAQTQQFGDGAISYNSGSVDPGVFGTFYVYADDPTFAGGAVTYQFSTTPVDQTASNGRVLFGKITTVSGSAKTGGGNTGGTTTGGAGGRGFIQ